MLIELQNIYKIYNAGKGDKEVRALDGVSLSIEKGSYNAIVGHSGSGKSTLMNILGCLDTPDGGEYLLDGRPVSQMTGNGLAQLRNSHIGFIFQGFNLIPSLSARENVELPLLYRGMERERRQCLAQDALERVGLASRMEHRPGEMSGGQQQRVAIARAIAAKPEIVLADEPTGNLDSRSGREVMEILLALWREGRTVVLITHDEAIANTAQRIIRIHDGQVAEDYRPGSICTPVWPQVS